jgi:hypothetical protein
MPEVSVNITSLLVSKSVLELHAAKIKATIKHCSIFFISVVLITVCNEKTVPEWCLKKILLSN